MLVFAAPHWAPYPLQLQPGPGPLPALGPDGLTFGPVPTPTHGQVGRFPCYKCGKTYRWKGNLSQHLRFECGKLPQFKCPYCPYRSKHRSDLKNKHMKCKHPGLPFEVPAP